ncbi:hypothetical protein BH11BAC4_BH11BAC4_08490 [soil metagenome]
MPDFLLWILYGFISWGLYNLIVSIYFLEKGNHLKGQLLEVFIKRLGKKYKCKELGAGITRYKWKKGWIIIKADFDEALRACNEKAVFAFMKPEIS